MAVKQDRLSCQRERPQIKEADDAIIRIVRTCVCGTDLWTYRNPNIKEGRLNSGHEAIELSKEWRGDTTK